RRHKYDGTITNSIAYPLTRALYGQEVRQPIGGDFGFTGELAQHYLEKHVWESDVARFGIDIWMTTEAITNGARICQSFLGAKIHDPKDPAADLSSMLRQVVGALFALMEAHAPTWLSVTESRKVPLFGFQYEVGVEPVNVNVERMIDLFHLGLTDLHGIWVRILSEDVLEQLSRLREVPARDFRIPDTLWARIIYDAALAHHRNVLPQEHLLKALTPLYLGKTASFVLDSQGLTTAEAEHLIETLCRTFEKEKEYLVTRWPQSHDARDVVSTTPARSERSQP
ncbi:MAG TPA: glycosyl transferase family 2, partial [Nitrospira sp.]|nr:glycosyl transferase family 2 [Nitrospira sp.]